MINKKAVLRRGSAQVRIALLIGHGSRVPGILECVRKIPGAAVVFVLSCIGEGIGTNEALKYRIASGIIKLQDFGKKPEDRERFARTVAGLLKKREINLIIMAGWMILMPPSFIREFSGHIFNIHPSILPAYPGKEEKVIRAQWHDKTVPAGCTMHYVDEGMDTGKVIGEDGYGYVVQKKSDYKKFSSFEEFEAAIHAKEDEVLCRGIKKLVRGFKKS